MPIDYSAPVLIVDDQEITVTLVKRIVSNMGFEQIDEAAGGEQALSMPRSRKYQLIISDLHMQPMNGLEFLCAIREHESVETIPFLMMTVNSTIGPAVAAKRGGANAYLLKPFTPEQLREKVTRILSQAERLRGPSLRLV